MKSRVSRFAPVLLVTLALSFAFTPAQPAVAAPGSDIFTDIYDCSMTWVGGKFRGCDSTGANWGQQTGYFKSIEACSCEGTTCTISWYKWDGAHWNYIGASEPAPEC
ncbi:MAG TPA: hypothetical protein VM733_07400 [Thermoanaerobaculia bacterium]|nr:hypothetical protein [Thermoanaerobaculia bacterium]